MKICPNCKEEHDGMFKECYQCFDCVTEEEYNARNKAGTAVYETKHDLRLEEMLKRSPDGCANILAYISGFMGDNEEFERAFWSAIEDGINVD